MRRKTKRDLIVFIGILVLIGGVFFFNSNVNRRALASKKDKERRAVESERRKQGMEIMNWDVIRKTKGNLRSGATFDERLLDYDGKRVNIAGFMVPDKKFREVTEFILLPLPIECYFCQRPPLHDVMYIQMEEGKTTNIYEEPVIINGTLVLNKGEGIQSFYHIAGATVGAGETDGVLTRKNIPAEHMAPGHDKVEVLEKGMEPPVKLPPETE
ncbi:MAG: DUF3299 domain-containing protein [Candidatus Hydrogenedentes bacterium]|nr:DUF3299 domain-containing protein [Candidatus Hydrogenedentota bacterium]